MALQSEFMNLFQWIIKIQQRRRIEQELAELRRELAELEGRR